MLTSKHAVWILNSALEHFVNKTNEAEAEIVRHEFFKDESPVPSASLMTLKTREKRIHELKGYLVEYREIIEFLRQSKERATDMVAEDFARTIKNAFEL